VDIEDEPLELLSYIIRASLQSSVQINSLEQKQVSTLESKVSTLSSGPVRTVERSTMAPPPGLGHIHDVGAVDSDDAPVSPSLAHSESAAKKRRVQRQVRCSAMPYPLICNAGMLCMGRYGCVPPRDAVDARSYPMDVTSSLPCIVNSRDQGWRYDVIRGRHSACVFMRCFV